MRNLLNQLYNAQITRFDNELKQILADCKNYLQQQLAQVQALKYDDKEEQQILEMINDVQSRDKQANTEC